MVARITARPLGRRGFVQGALVAEWPAIVGPALAERVLPMRIAFPRGERSGGTLHLRVGSGAEALQVQHLAPLIIERINGHFGYRAVAGIVIAQGPLPARPRNRPSAPPAPRAEAARALDAMLAGVDDPVIKAALNRLGRRLAAKW